MFTIQRYIDDWGGRHLKKMLRRKQENSTESSAEALHLQFCWSTLTVWLFFFSLSSLSCCVSPRRRAIAYETTRRCVVANFMQKKSLNFKLVFSLDFYFFARLQLKWASQLRERDSMLSAKSKLNRSNQVLSNVMRESRRPSIPDLHFCQWKLNFSFVECVVASSFKIQNVVFSSWQAVRRWN